MPFVPHTSQDEESMLDAIGVETIEDLFDEIPPALRAGVLTNTPAGISEQALLRLMSDRSKKDEVDLCFIGAGAYQHHIPSAVWDLVTRGEFMTAYTPYQAEASQGTLQLIYEFQTMITRLTAMEVANASVYDGASALAEAILMAVRANRKSKSRNVLVPGNLHPSYLSTCRNILHNQKIKLQVIPYDQQSGCIKQEDLRAFEGEDFAALVIQYPNFFGGLEMADELTTWAHGQGQLVIGVVNPTALALLAPPGTWGDTGADIVVGEGQPLGIPVASGGPYLGFMCCKQAIVRQMPGRIIGKTLDLDGKVGFALTLQAREQHIRRAKATSNICTNQGLLVTAATIYMSLIGDLGLRSIASQSHNGTVQLIGKALEIKGITRRFTSPVFHEIVLELPCRASQVLQQMCTEGILGGYDLGQMDAALENCILVNVTETKTPQDIEDFITSLRAAAEVAAC